MKINNIQKLISSNKYREALSLYTQLHVSSIHPNNFTFPSLLKACISLYLIPQTQQIHSQIIKLGFNSDAFTSTSLINTYMKLDLFQYAVDLFDAMPNPTLPSFNALISGFSQQGRFNKSLEVFNLLRLHEFSPSSVSFASVLLACRNIKQGSQMHGLLIKHGYESEVFVATSLLSMYSSCGEPKLAQYVFGMICEKSLVSYNAMISCYNQIGDSFKALDLFREVENPNTSTLLSVLSICSKIPSSILGKETHCYILKHEFSSDVMIGTTLVDMYSKSGLIKSAYRVFMCMKNKNVVTWNTIISGLLHNEYIDISLALFYKLRLEGLEPDSATWNLMINGLLTHHEFQNADVVFNFFKEMIQNTNMHSSMKILTSLLRFCSSNSYLHYGKEIHSRVIRIETSYQDEILDTALIHMYMTCGYFGHAHKIFDQCRRHYNSLDPTFWNAMIHGYGRNGENKSAIKLFEEMQNQKVQPNSTTLLIVLSSYAHTGQIVKGCELLRVMENEYGIKPTKEHFGSVVDLLCRAGKVEEAWEMIKEVKEPSESMLYSLLGACRCYCNARVGEVVASKILEREKGHSSGTLVEMRSMYAEQGWFDEVQKLSKRLIKVQGRSLIQGF